MDLGSIRLEIDEKKKWQKSESKWKKRTSNTFFREQIIFPYLRFSSRWDRERKEILPVIAGFSAHFFFPQRLICAKNYNKKIEPGIEPGPSLPPQPSPVLSPPIIRVIVGEKLATHTLLFPHLRTQSSPFLWFCDLFGKDAHMPKRMMSSYTIYFTIDPNSVLGGREKKSKGATVIVTRFKAWQNREE